MTKRLRPQQNQEKVKSNSAIIKKRRFLTVFVCFLFVIVATVYVLGAVGVLPGTWGNGLAAVFVILSVVPPFIDRLFPKKSEQVASHPVQQPSIATISTSTPSPIISPTPSSSYPPSIVSISSSMPSPVFLVNMSLSGPDEFYGRERERMKLVERTIRGACTSIVGPRRIGKTWLLTYLGQVASSQLTKEARISYIDVSLPSCSTVSGFVTEILKTLGLLDFPSHTQPTLLLLEEIVKNMASKQHTFVLCIDEFEGLAASPSEFNLAFFTGLRALTQVGLCIVTASKIPLIDIVSGNTKTSPFFNVFFQVKLSPFEHDDAENFVHTKGKQGQLTDVEREVMLRYGRLGKRMLWPPLKLQLVGELLLEEKHLASRGGVGSSLQGNPHYLQKFKERLDETYQGMVKS